MSNVPVFRLLVDPVSGPVLPVESVPVTRRWTSQTSQTPKWLDEGQQSGTLAPFSSNRNSSAKTCPWPPKFLRWVFIYSYFISSVVIVIFPDHRYFLAFAWDLGNWIFRYFLFARFPLGSCQPPSNRFRNQEEAKWRYPCCHFSWLWSSYRRRSLSRSGLNLQFTDCPCRFALVSLCSNSLWVKVPVGALSNFLVASCSSQH